MMRAALWTAVILILASGLPAGAQTSETSCVACHTNEDVFDAETIAAIGTFAEDVHAEVGLSCQDCHGGNPDSGLADDMDAAMNAAWKENPYVGAPERTAIPALCGRCHSDLAYMRRFKPDAHVDQESEYWTSQHGLSLAKGDVKVATCIDCHGVHGIRRSTDPRSSVYPTQVAETCATCHSKPEHMAGHTLKDGSPIPVDQFSRWRRSVHAAAMFEKEDLSAPTCNDCHGNHGATPPGVESVGNVCGQCHGREAGLFRASGKHQAFLEHNEMLAEAGGAGCTECHDSMSPAVERISRHGFSECATCHDNHAIIRPTIALLGPLPATPCALCHEGSGPLAAEVPELKETWKRYVERRDALLAAADGNGITGDDRFDWLVDQALSLDTHTLGLTEGGGPAALRPEFKRLFDKFRIGKTHYSYEDPAAGGEVTAEVIRCNHCHTDPDGAGLIAARDYINRMQELTSLTARAERILLTARRGGVEVRSVLPEMDAAVGAQIELEALVHGFSAGENEAFQTKHTEGIEHARAALLAGQESLKELSQRRRGLMLSLGFIMAALLGLGLKIKSLSR